MGAAKRGNTASNFFCINRRITLFRRRDADKSADDREDILDSVAELTADKFS